MSVFSPDPDKMFKKLFRAAPRLVAGEDMWRRIAAESDLSPSRDRSPARSRDLPRAWAPLRAAAALALAAGAVGLILGQYRRLHDPAAAVAASRTASLAASAETGESLSDVVDPELLAWHSGLGEFQADDAGTDGAMDEWMDAGVMDDGEGEGI